MGLLEDILARSRGAMPAGMMLPQPDQTDSTGTVEGPELAAALKRLTPKKSPFPDIGPGTPASSAIPWGPFAGLLEPGAGQLGSGGMPQPVADPLMPGTMQSPFSTAPERAAQALS